MRLQLDLIKFSGLQGCFDMLFSSGLLGVYKPKPESYLKVSRSCHSVTSNTVSCRMVLIHTDLCDQGT